MRLPIRALLPLVLAACTTAPRTTVPAATPTGQIGRPIEAVEAPPGPPTADAPSKAEAPPPPLAESEPIPRRQRLPAAERAARGFFATYIRFLFGRIPAPDVGDVAFPLRAELRRNHDLTTPAERTARPRILRVTVSPSGPPTSVRATATLTAGHGGYRLTATLEPRHGSWIVVDVDG